MESQFEILPEKLKEICNAFITISEEHLVDPVITRVSDPVEGESGVHTQHRAVDFRNQYFNGKHNVWLYSQETVDAIVNEINSRYPRNDGKLVCLHHSFKGEPSHFHLQCDYDWLTEDERKRLYGTSE